jgi:hypothetical protein
LTVCRPCSIASEEVRRALRRPNAAVKDTGLEELKVVPGYFTKAIPPSVPHIFFSLFGLRTRDLHPCVQLVRSQYRVKEIAATQAISTNANIKSQGGAASLSRACTPIMRSVKFSPLDL